MFMIILLHYYTNDSYTIYSNIYFLITSQVLKLGKIDCWCDSDAFWRLRTVISATWTVLTYLARYVTYQYILREAKLNAHWSYLNWSEC